MPERVTNHEDVIKHHVVSVPSNIEVAKVEILTFRGAPAFPGTILAKLHFDNNQSVALYSKMSGVVNRILVNDDDEVSCDQRLVELRNTNTSRTRTGNKIKPSSLPIPRPSGKFFEEKKNQSQEDNYYLINRVFICLRNLP